MKKFENCKVWTNKQSQQMTRFFDKKDKKENNKVDKSIRSTYEMVRKFKLQTI